MHILNILSLKLPQFCCSGTHCYGKDLWYSPYLLQVRTSSFSKSLAWPCLFAGYTAKRQISFQTTIFHLAYKVTAYKKLWKLSSQPPAFKNQDASHNNIFFSFSEKKKNQNIATFFLSLYIYIWIKTKGVKEVNGDYCRQ